jgi:hypothetical protein
MTPDVSGAEERARLAAADLVAAANDVIRWRTLRWEDARDEVDAAVLSRRWTSCAPSRKLDDARDDLDFASRARTEIGSISASLNGVAAGGGQNAVAATQTVLIGRLVVLAAECERRAILLRS